MKIEELKKVKDRRPFEPFEVRMADRRSYLIKHPDAIAWDPEHARIGMCGLAGGGWEIVDIASITSLGVPSPKSPI